MNSISCPVWAPGSVTFQALPLTSALGNFVLCTHHFLAEYSVGTLAVLQSFLSAALSSQVLCPGEGQEERKRKKRLCSSVLLGPQLRVHRTPLPILPNSRWLAGAATELTLFIFCLLEIINFIIWCSLCWKFLFHLLCPFFSRQYS